MARDFNQFRNANAKLISKNVNFFGKRWAIQDNADGYSAIDVSVTDTTQDVKLYLEGSNDITVFPVASDVSKLCKSALMSFPNITTIYLFSPTLVDIAEETKNQGDYLYYLNSLTKIYVPSALLDRYKSTYSNLSTKFDIIIEDLTITIGWENNNTLTSEEVTRQLNMLESAYLNQATKLVIDSRYTDYLDVVWAYNFTEKCSALNNNIWHGTTKVSFASYTIADNTQDHILTASVVENELAKISSDKTTELEKITVPVDFTSYESGSITEIQSFMNTNSIDKLVTTYEAGAMELDLQGDIVETILNIGKTLEQALIYARYISYNHITDFRNKNDLIIIPPINAGVDNIPQSYGAFYNSPNIVYIADLTYTGNIIRELAFINSCHIIEAKITLNGDIYATQRWFYVSNYGTGFLKRFIFTLNGNSASNDTNVSSNVLEKIIMNNYNSNFSLKAYLANGSSKFTRQALLDLINSLGTPTTKKTLSLGASSIGTTNLAKLTQADIQLAYNKNWQLSPTPSAFTFTIGSNSYSCDFGSNWTTWVASAYNTDGFYILNNKVYDSSNNVVQLDGIDVADTDMIRYGDVFTL